MARDGRALSRFTDDLFAQADLLLAVDPRKPKQANLRRAVSSAYYGLFHFLIEEATALVVGTSHANKPLRQLVGRGFTHTAMKEACAEFGKGTPRDLLKPFWILYAVPSCTPLQNLANIFVDLQQERHRSDYDMSRPMTQQEAALLVERARIAITEWQLLKKTQPALAQFCALCLFSWNNWKTR